MGTCTTATMVSSASSTSLSRCTSTSRRWVCIRANSWDWQCCKFATFLLVSQVTNSQLESHLTPAPTTHTVTSTLDSLRIITQEQLHFLDSQKDSTQLEFRQLSAPTIQNVKRLKLRQHQKHSTTAKQNNKRKNEIRNYTIFKYLKWKDTKNKSPEHFHHPKSRLKSTIRCRGKPETIKRTPTFYYWKDDVIVFYLIFTLFKNTIKIFSS